MGALVNLVLRAAQRLEPAAEAIREEIRQSRVVGSDETGARVNGQNHWQWVFVTDSASYDVIASSRGSQVIYDVMADAVPLVWVRARLVERPTSEKMSPEEVVTLPNEYLSEMTAAIRPWGGYINNFIGDAIVAFFGAPVDQPDKEWRAVAAARAMSKRLAELNRRRVARGEMPIDNGVGISTGEAVAGQIGSLERLMYTVIGDTVNVAARLETLTKEYPEHRILSAGRLLKR